MTGNIEDKVNSMYEFGNQIGIDATPSFLSI